jgi:hypothetical protein
VDLLNVLLAAMGVVIGVVSAVYARNSYLSAKIPSFPKTKSNLSPIEIKHLSKEALKFNRFLRDNADRKVYLNILLDADHFEISDLDAGRAKWTNIWLESFEKVTEADELSSKNSNGLNVTFHMSETNDAKIYWDKGRYLIKGYFCILGYGGPQQGYMGSVLRSDDI